MSRLNYIRQVRDSYEGDERQSLFAALVECLAPDECCEFLTSDFEMAYPYRRIVLKKAGRDIQEGVRECHASLISDLVASLEETKGKSKQSCATCLAYLFDYVDTANQTLIIRALLLANEVSLRKRACRKLRRTWSLLYADILISAWSKHEDPEVAQVMIDHLEVEHLEANFYPLAERVVNSWHFTKLFIRIGDEAPSKLNLLREFDGITYAYVLVKLGYCLTPKKAIQLFKAYRYDKRMGLLIWCFGRMKLWGVLKTAANRIAEPRGKSSGCTQCEESMTIYRGAHVEDVPFGETTLPIASDLYQCLNCKSVYRIHRGEWLLVDPVIIGIND